MDFAPNFPNTRKAIAKYLDLEINYMPAPGFAISRNARFRSQAVSTIATHSPTVAPDALIPYLAMNYFDRYFSYNQFDDLGDWYFLPNQDVEEEKRDSEKVRLIALCCLLISATWRLEDFSLDRFLVDNPMGFVEEGVEELKYIIVNSFESLPLTPFVYLDYYSRVFKNLGGFKRSCINEIIVQAQGENQFVRYRPSTVAMSAFLVAAKILYPSGYKEHRYEEAEETSESLFECVSALRDLCDRKNIKIEPPHDELIATLTDEVGNKTHLEEGLLEAGTTKREAKKPTHDEEIAILTDEIGNKTNLEEGSLEWEQKAISNEIEEIVEAVQSLDRVKAVVTSDEIKEIEGLLCDMLMDMKPMNFDLKWPAYVPS